MPGAVASFAPSTRPGSTAQDLTPNSINSTAIEPYKGDSNEEIGSTPKANPNLVIHKKVAVI